MASASESKMQTNWQTERASIRERNQYMYNNSMFSDVQFSVVNSKDDTVTVPAHKYVLAISSPVFQAMFYGDIAETGRTIELPDCTAEGLLELFRYMYYDEVKLTGSVVMEVLYLAKKYIVPSLVQKCTYYLEEELEANDVFAVFPQVIKLEEKELQQHCWEIIDNDTIEAVASDSFLEISQELLCEVLERGTLHIQEVELFKAVDRWANENTQKQGMSDHGKSKRAVLGEKAVHLIRFPLMPEEEFAATVLDSDILNKKEIVNMVKHFNSVSSRSDFLSTDRLGKSTTAEKSCKRFKRFSLEKWEKKFNTSDADAIIFCVSKPVYLTGVRLVGNQERIYKVKLNVYKTSDRENILFQTDGKIKVQTDSTIVNEYYGMQITLGQPLRLKRNEDYTIEAIITGNYYTSFGYEGQEEVICDGVKFTFRKVESARGTNHERGQFAELLFY